MYHCSGDDGPRFIDRVAQFPILNKDIYTTVDAIRSRDGQGVFLPLFPQVHSWYEGKTAAILGAVEARFVKEPLGPCKSTTGK